MAQSKSRSANILLPGLDSNHIDGTNRSLIGLQSLIGALGYGADLAKMTIPTLANKGVQQSGTGIIQNPAVSAIRSGRFPGGR